MGGMGKHAACFTPSPFYPVERPQVILFGRRDDRVVSHYVTPIPADLTKMH